MAELNWSIQVRNDAAADWTADDPTLLVGQLGFESDTGLLKVGDGTTAWTSLPYISGIASVVDWLNTPSSTNLRTAVTDETGTGALVFATNPTLSGVTFTDATDIVLGSTTGTKIGTATTQKLGFFNEAPVTQPTALTAQETTITFTEPGAADYALQDVINTNAYGFADAEEARTFIGVVENLQVRVAELESKLQSLGLLA